MYTKTPVLHLRYHSFLGRLLPCFFRLGFSLVWDFLVRPGWLTSKPQRSTCPCLCSTHHHTWNFFMWVLETELGCLCGNRLSAWAIFPPPGAVLSNVPGTVLTSVLRGPSMEGYARRGEQRGDLYFLTTCWCHPFFFSDEVYLHMRLLDLMFCCRKNLIPSDFQGCTQIRHETTYL